MKIEIRGDIVCNDDKWVYDWLDLDSTCPKDLQSAIDRANGEPLDVWINSGGGDLFSGIEMYEALRSHPGEVRIHIIQAGSAATLPACAGRSEISPAGMMMVHNVASGAWGDCHVMDRTGETLRKANRAVSAAYAAKTGKPEAELLKLMDRETWFTADEAVELGLVDAVSQPVRLTASSGGLPLEAIDRIKATVKNPFQKSAAHARAQLEFLNMKGAAR